MRSKNEHPADLEPHSFNDLRVLSEVDDDPNMTQRQLAARAGIALGLANLLLRNLTQKGYVRAAKATWQRRIYTLTPRGLLHKIRLTISYVDRVLDHYRNVRTTLREQLEPIGLNMESRIAIYGANEFSELIYLALRDFGIEDIDIFEASGSSSRKFLGLPVLDIKSLRPGDYDRVIMGILGGSEEAEEQLEERGVVDGKLMSFFANGNKRGKH